MCHKIIFALFAFLFIQPAMAIYQEIDHFDCCKKHISYHAVGQKLHTATQLKTSEGGWGTAFHEEEEGVTLSIHHAWPDIHLQFRLANGSIQCHHIPEKFFLPLTPHTQFRGICFESLQDEQTKWILSVSLWEEGYRCLDREDFFWFSRHTHFPVIRAQTVNYLDQLLTQDVLNSEKKFHFLCLPIYEFCNSFTPQRGKSLQLLRRLKKCFGYVTNL